MGLLERRRQARLARLIEIHDVVGRRFVGSPRAMMAADRTSHHPVDPASQRIWLLQGMEPRMDDHEDLLDDIVDRLTAHSQAPHRSPNKIEITFVYRCKRREGVARRLSHTCSA